MTEDQEILDLYPDDIWCSPWGVEHQTGRASGVGSSAGVKLEVDLGQTAGQDGGPHVVLAAHADTPGQGK